MKISYIALIGTAFSIISFGVKAEWGPCPEGSATCRSLSGIGPCGPYSDYGGSNDLWYCDDQSGFFGSTTLYTYDPKSKKCGSKVRKLNYALCPAGSTKHKNQKGMTK